MVLKTQITLLACGVILVLGGVMAHLRPESGWAAFLCVLGLALSLRWVLGRVVSPLLLAALLVFGTSMVSAHFSPLRTYFDHFNSNSMVVVGSLVGIASLWIELPQVGLGGGEQKPLIEEADPPSWIGISGVAWFVVLVGFAAGACLAWLDVRNEPRPEVYFWGQLLQKGGIGLLAGTLVAAAYVSAMARERWRDPWSEQK